MWMYMNLRHSAIDLEAATREQKRIDCELLFEQQNIHFTRIRLISHQSQNHQASYLYEFSSRWPMMFPDLDIVYREARRTFTAQHNELASRAWPNLQTNTIRSKNRINSLYRTTQGSKHTPRNTGYIWSGMYEVRTTEPPLLFTV